jgi:ribosomal protein S18 acetylase RimI-like enzyme
VIHYRSFRNTDPPILVDIWNEVFTGRGAVRLRHSTPLEHYVFAKPYFDPAGLILALDEREGIGFVHAGFGDNQDHTGISPLHGVTCMLGVRPSYRRRGIGSELLRRSEEYLRGKGATAFHAGPAPPYDPFYLGLYGGSEPAGFLASDPAAEPFFTRREYRVCQTNLVFQRRLDRPVKVVDSRFAGHRSRFELRIVPRKRAETWWQEATRGLVEPFEFRLEEKLSGHVVAQASVWEMEGFSWRWNQPSVGLTDLLVQPNWRRQGVGKFLLAQILRYLQEQYFGIVEMHTPQGNDIAVKLFRAVGFEQVDTGHAFRRE